MFVDSQKWQTKSFSFSISKGDTDSYAESSRPTNLLQRSNEWRLVSLMLLALCSFVLLLCHSFHSSSQAVTLCRLLLRDPERVGSSSSWREIYCTRTPCQRTLGDLPLPNHTTNFFHLTPSVNCLSLWTERTWQSYPAHLYLSQRSFDQGRRKDVTQGSYRLRQRDIWSSDAIIYRSGTALASQKYSANS